MDSWEARMSARAKERQVSAGAAEYLQLLAQPEPPESAAVAFFVRDITGTYMLINGRKYVKVDGGWRLALHPAAR